MDSGFLAPFDPEIAAALIETVGTSQFAPSLLRAANSVNRIEELFGYLVEDEGEPKAILSASTLGGCEERVAAYVERFYRHDPAVYDFRESDPGTSFGRRVRLSNILAHDYRRICFAQPGFSEKLSYGWRGDGYMLVLSFYRRGESPKETLIGLSSLVALVLPIMTRHHAPIAREAVSAILERRMARSFPILSQREMQVCARTIIGHDAGEIASELGIGPGSVLTYRQRAYQKVGISRAGQLLSDLIN